MKKKLYPLAIGLIGAFFMTSCESEKPQIDPEVISEINKWMFEEMLEPNYLWDLPGSLDYTLAPDAFFKSMIHKDDKISQIWDNRDAPSVETLTDPGFEYAVNKYLDETYYYMIYYVKPKTSAANEGLLRGYLIKSVNDVKVTADNSATLLSNAAKAGKVKVLAFYPGALQDMTFTFTAPEIGYVDNPVLLPNPTDTIVNNKKVGYLIYNKFTAGANSVFDNALVGQLQTLASKEINYLVLDLRYNGGGDLATTSILGSALVKQRNVTEPFIIQKRRSDLNDVLIPLVSKTVSGVAIPELGKRLEKIYILIGQNTAGASVSFINALKRSGWGDNVVLVGEKTATTENISNSPIQTNENWSFLIALTFIAGKDGEYKYANYPNGFLPNKAVKEVDETNNNLRLLPLGSTGETVYKAVIDDIKGIRTLSSTVDGSYSSSIIMSSLEKKSSFNQATVDIESMK